jgi:hypothetical protein
MTGLGVQADIEFRCAFSQVPHIISRGHIWKNYYLEQDKVVSETDDMSPLLVGGLWEVLSVVRPPRSALAAPA